MLDSRAMKIKALSVTLLTPLLCRCHTAAPTQHMEEVQDEPATQAEAEVMPPVQAEEEVAVQIPLTPEETEDLQKVIAPLCETQDDITVHYHGIQYKGDKTKPIPLGTLSVAAFQTLASSTQCVATGEVNDDFELYSFHAKNGKKAEAYISLSNREYGIELTGAPAVYAPEFHDLILSLRNALVLQQQAESAAKDTQH